MSSAWPIIVITGGNAGIGFGICQRLLSQLSYAHPPDSDPQFRAVLAPDVFSGREHELEVAPADGVTLVLACRSLKRAEGARTKLYGLLDLELEKRRKLHGQDAHAIKFRRNVKIELLELDLAQVGSVFKAAEELKRSYPYISHLICNAGITSFSRLDYIGAARQMLLQSFILGTSMPRFQVANVGERSADGLGWVWQCNVFSHFALFRTLEPLLAQTPLRTPLGAARVIWMSSLEATPEEYDPDDWQLLKTKENYPLSKFQTDLLATRLDLIALEADAKANTGARSGEKVKVKATATATATATRHIIVQPGVVATSIVASYLNFFTAWCMRAAFWIARWLGSPHHNITPENAATAFVYAALAPLLVLDACRAAFTAAGTDSEGRRHFEASHIAVEGQRHKLEHLRKKERKAGVTPGISAGAGESQQKIEKIKQLDKIHGRPSRFGSEVSRWGVPRVGMTEVREWDVFEEESVALLSKFDRLLGGMREEEEKERKERKEGVGRG